MSVGRTLTVVGLLGLGSCVAAERFSHDPEVLLTPNLALPADLPLSPEIGATVCLNVVDMQSCSGDMLLATKTAGERKVLDSSDIPYFTKLITVASEDRDFYNHNGVNGRGIVRAAAYNVADSVQERQISYAQGGSSLTILDVEWRYGLDLDGSVLEKKEEAELALGLEIRLEEPCARDVLGINLSSFSKENPLPDEQYSLIKACVKDQILVDVLNRVPLGGDAYGIGKAALQTFNKELWQLSEPQQLILLSRFRSPSLTDLINDSAEGRAREVDNLRARYTSIANDLLSGGALTKLMGGDEEAAKRYHQALLDGFEPALATVQDYSPKSTLVTDMARPIAAEHAAVRALDEAARILGISSDEVAEHGYRIVTTLDPEMQTAAAQTVFEANANNDGGFQAAMTAVDVNGRTVAMVGGADRSKSQVNLATGVEGGGSGRDAGSSLKIGIAAVAVEEGRRNSQNDLTTIESQYVLAGADNGEDYVINTGVGCNAVFGIDPPCQMTMEQVYGVSSNVGAASHLGAVGEAPAYGAVRAYEILRELGSDIPGEPYASMLVGSPGVSVYSQAVVAAGMFLREGRAIEEPTLVDRIYDANGEIVHQFVPPQNSKQVVTQEVAREVTQIMRASVEQPYGTAYGAFETPPNVVAQKTGTATRNTDVWSVGAAADNETGGVAWAYWIGHPDGEVELPDNFTSRYTASLAGRFLSLSGIGDDGARLPSNR